MELKVYNWEYFERWKKWYLIFALVILVVAILSILSNNIVWWIFILMITWWYLYYTTKINNIITMIIGKNSLQIWKTVYPREILKWFVLEYHTQKKKIHNIVIIDSKKESKIYTIKDTAKNVENFVNKLNGKIPMLEKYEQTNFDKFIRKIKL